MKFRMTCPLITALKKQRPDKTEVGLCVSHTAQSSFLELNVPLR